MREKVEKQIPLMAASIDHPQAKELEQISRILDANPTIFELAMQDLCHGVRKHIGAKGMSAEQVVRYAIVKQMFQCSYKELAFHIIDSISLRRFARIGIADKGFKKSVLCKNIKRLSPETWEAINQHLLSYAKDKDIEKGREVRIDCTVVESNIHAPCDSNQLFDSVRVLTNILTKAKVHVGGIVFHDHCRRAKRRLLDIQYAKSKKQRDSKYADLIKVTEKCVRYAKKAIDVINKSTCADVGSLSLSLSLSHYVDLATRVIDQTKRRIIHGESVPACEKVVSIFEPHTDIIKKDNRDTYYGHKICLSGGKSNLITDCLITKGNPADTDLTETMLDRQHEIYRRYPIKVVLDGGFASKENLKIAKSKKIKDVCFAKKRGLEIEDMCRSEWVYKRLRKFRAGIEAGISWLKRCFSLWRCTWKGFHSFKSYVWASIVSANLLTLARKQLA